MSQVNSLIAERLKKNEPSSKMAQMAQKSASGGLTTFNGLFQVSELSQNEKEELENLLHTYAKNSTEINKDLKVLISLTSEVKAINHQAALLHGERIKQAHQLLIRYKEGAFSAWLTSTYGNRQTPYNLMQYYEFYQSLPLPLKEKAEEMPRQAIYTLASREGDFNKKVDLVRHYRGETKSELLIKIRDMFPLSSTDQRKENPAATAITYLEKVHSLLTRKKIHLTLKQKESLKELMTSLSSILKEK